MHLFDHGPPLEPTPDPEAGLSARQIDHHRRTYWKCDRVPLTHGAATDIRVSWPACTRFEAHPDG